MLQKFRNFFNCYMYNMYIKSIYIKGKKLRFKSQTKTMSKKNKLIKKRKNDGHY